LKLPLRVGEVLHFIVQPRLGHFEVGDETLTFAGRHGSGKGGGDGHGQRGKNKTEGSHAHHLAVPARWRQRLGDK
jgi:hypothetical protein